MSEQVIISRDVTCNINLLYLLLCISDTTIVPGIDLGKGINHNDQDKEAN